MKISSEDQSEINDFVRQYVDTARLPGRKVLWGYKSFEGKNGLAHEEAVHRVCKALSLRKIPFATEVPLKCGNVLDVCCPTHIKKIIEVMHSESDDYMTKKILRLPNSLQGEVMILRACEVLDLPQKDVLEGVFIL